MVNDLLTFFLKNELNDSVREIIAAAVKESENSHSDIAIRIFEFNCFDVKLDFRSATATLSDVLSTGAGSEQMVPLPLFLKVCGLS